MSATLAFLIITSAYFVFDTETGENLYDSEEKSQKHLRMNDNADSYADFTYDTNNKNEVEITGYTGSDNHLTIPEIIDGNPVKRIGDNAFSGNQEIISIIFPDTVFRIGDSAFQNCKSLESVIFGRDIKLIGERAFKDCVSLKYMQFKDDLPDIGNKGILNTPDDLTVYYVEGKKIDGSSWSSLNKVMLSPPASPTGFTAIPDVSRIDVSWQIPDGVDKETILGYEVRYKKSEDDEWVKLFIENKLNAELKNLSNGTEYEVCVCSVNIAGPGEPSKILTAIPFTVPEAPVLNVAEGDYGMILTWNAPNNMGLSITEYSVYQGGVKIASKDFVDREYAITNLEKGVMYSFSVTASNSAGEGLRSNPVEITVKETYTISFEAGDGVSVDSQALKEGDEILHPLVPQREGYLFARWSPEIPDCMPAHDLVVNAVWHTVTAIPNPVDNLYYTGECQIGISADERYDVSGNYSMIDADDYVAYLTLKEGFVWEDKTYEIKEVLWKISPKTVYVFPEKNQCKLYSDEDSELKYSLSENIDTSGNLERVTGEDPGNYKISIGSLSIENNNYLLEMSEETVYFTIVAVCPGAPTDLEVIFDEGCTRLQWCAPEFDGGCELSCYEVWARTGNDDVWTLYETVENQTSCDVLPEPDTIYEFAVKAVNSAGGSELSGTVFVEVNDTEEDENIPDEYYKIDNLTFIILSILIVVLCLVLIIWIGFK